MDEALERVDRLGHTHMDTIEHKMQQYDEWSQHYEEDTILMIYRAPEISTKLLYEMVNNQQITLGRSTKIIDFAAGTGLIARYLQQRGYCGEIDAQDGSEGMLEKAKQNGLYSNIFHCILKPDNALPLHEEHYDIGFFSGGLSPSQVPACCLKILLRHIKVGGVLIFTSRANKSNLAFKQGLDLEIQNMCDAGIWTEVFTEEVEEFQRATLSDEEWLNGSSDKQAHPFIPGTVYCYRKLK